MHRRRLAGERERARAQGTANRAPCITMQHAMFALEGCAPRQGWHMSWVCAPLHLHDSLHESAAVFEQQRHLASGCVGMHWTVSHPPALRSLAQLVVATGCSCDHMTAVFCKWEGGHIGWAVEPLPGHALAHPCSSNRGQQPVHSSRLLQVGGWEHRLGNGTPAPHALAAAAASGSCALTTALSR